MKLHKMQAKENIQQQKIEKHNHLDKNYEKLKNLLRPV